MTAADGTAAPAPMGEATLATLRQLYTEAQQWARHYEQLIVNANTLIISADAIFVGQAMGEHVSRLQTTLLLLVPLLLSVFGGLLTQTLFRLYASSISRLVRYETLLGCFEPLPGAEGEALLPQELRQKVVRRPATVQFFLGLHGLTVLGYLGLGLWALLR